MGGTSLKALRKGVGVARELSGHALGSLATPFQDSGRATPPEGLRTSVLYDDNGRAVVSIAPLGERSTTVYDALGRTLAQVNSDGVRTTMVWDYENRLVKTIQPSGGITSMSYDADGLRLKKEDATGTKLFVWDDQNYLAETDAAGATETAFTTEPSTYGSLISHRKSGATTTYHFDALGSTRALTDESEAVLERYNYSAFGTLQGSPTMLTPFLWGGMVGYYWDAALATQYIRARHYQPAIARWLSLDPIGFAGGDANLFRYVGNSPTSGGTERRVRISAAAYGRLQLVIAPIVLNYLSLARVYAGRKGRFLSHDPIRYPDGFNAYAGWFILSTADPTGMCRINPSVVDDPNGKGFCTRIKSTAGPWKLAGVLPNDIGEPVAIAPVLGNNVRQIHTVACMYERQELGCYHCSPCCFAIPKTRIGRKDGKGYGSVVLNVVNDGLVATGVSLGVGDVIGGLTGEVISVIDSSLGLGLEIGQWGFSDPEDEEQIRLKCPQTFGPNTQKMTPDDMTSVGLPKVFKCKTP